MTECFKRIFSTHKPVIGMVHLGALPGTPLFDPKLDLVAAARVELLALQDAGFDAVMFGNENDRPYEFNVDTASTAAMAAIIGQLKSDIKVPFGVNVLWDPLATVALGVATGAQFVREIFTGVYASDMGSWTTDAARPCVIVKDYSAQTWPCSITYRPSSRTRWTNDHYPTARAAQFFRQFQMRFWCLARLPERLRQCQN